MAHEIPSTQKAWLVTKRGHPKDVLSLRTNFPIPVPKEDEVLIKVQAAALNPVGWKTMFFVPRFIKRRPYIPEYDFSGVISDPNGSPYQVGDAVFGLCEKGSMAEYIAVPKSCVSRRPSSVSPIDAAGLSLVGQTAWAALFEYDHVEPGQTIFINGGSSSVGGTAIQMAKSKGLKVYASASGKNEEYVRSLGADVFIDYTKQPLHEHLMQNPPSPKFHAIFDAVALNDASLYKHSAAYLAPGGSYISTGPMPHSFAFSQLLKTSNMYFHTFMFPRWLGGCPRKFKIIVGPLNKQDRLERLRELVADGSIKGMVDSVFDFADLIKAYDKILTNRARGKVVVKVDT